VTGFNNAQSGTGARSVSLSSSPISQTVTITDPAAAATTLVALASQARSDTVRPVAHPLLYQSAIKTFSYDGNGNTTAATIAGIAWTYNYDPENKLVKASKTSGGVIATYAYDPLGRRTQKSGTGVTQTYFVSDGTDEIAEYTGAGALSLRYVPGSTINQPIASVSSTGTRKFLQYDRHGSVIAVANNSGTEIEGPYTYDAYGNGAPTTGVAYKYVGMRLDAETGLYFDRARYYSSILGRFFQPDPVGYTADLNLYPYVGNDPVDRSDPIGMVSCDVPGMTDCPDIPRASPQVEQASIRASEPQSMSPGRPEQGSVVLTSKKDDSVTRTLTGRDAGRPDPKNPQHQFNFDFKKTVDENTGATEHFHPGSDASIPRVREVTNQKNVHPSKTDLQGTMNGTKAPVIVRASDGTISETYRLHGVDHYVVLKGPGPTVSVPSEISHNFVVDPSP
jgi:RHS repeat-associated protein